MFGKKKQKTGTRIKWSIISTGSAIAAAMLVRKTLKTSYEVVKHQPPPKNPYSPAIGWREAIVWTAATGAAMGVGRLLARRGAATAWEKKTGTAPPDQGND